MGKGKGNMYGKSKPMGMTKGKKILMTPANSGKKGMKSK